MTRRGMVKRSLASAAALAFPIPADAQSTGNLETGAGLIMARKKLGQRRRPIILDDDGDIVYDDATLKGREAFLALRMHDARDCGINSVAWCIMWAIAVKGKTATRYWQTQMQDVHFQENLPDPTDAVAQFGRKHGVEIFGSLRMNDCHDAFGLPFGRLVYPLKVEHPEMLLGKEHPQRPISDRHRAAMWSELDYAREKVREDRLRWVERTAMRYDIDGLDMNFDKNPIARWSMPARFRNAHQVSLNRCDHHRCS